MNLHCIIWKLKWLLQRLSKRQSLSQEQSCSIMLTRTIMLHFHFTWNDPWVQTFHKVESISSCRLQIHLSIPACIMWNHTGGSFPVFLNLIISFSKQFYPFKDCLFGLRSCSQNFTAHYACRNADLNFRAAENNGQQVAGHDDQPNIF